MQEDRSLDDEKGERIFSAYEIAYLLLFVIGITLYFWYAVTYDAWFDIGLYVVSMPFIGFGLVGLILNRLNRESHESKQKA